MYKFPHAGQNLGSVWSTSLDYFQVTDPLLVDIIRRWYDEVADCELSLLQSYHNIEDGIQRGHFTQLVRDEATHMGCAVSFFLQPHPEFGLVHALLMACNYSEGNLLEAPTYAIGQPCSKCKKCNKKYLSLCEQS
ncbi:GLIPR1-like protein 1 [Ctenocephalides felis]|uniref:GLIPR1-like protein 1 n=1 Tax=Ctenocephalides felis TaxID=7515 RepID=UPI000E6E49DB|nr:GLIPR1-like protein 1 [Ctenocephalides felis]